MSEKMNWSINVRVTAGPTVVAGDELDLDAYDKIDATVEAGQSMDIEVQPGGTGKVRLLVLKSNLYGSDLTYTVEGSTKTIKLDQPLLLLGEGAVGLLPSVPKKLRFTNSLAENVTLEILVGRKAVEAPPPPPPP